MINYSERYKKALVTVAMGFRDEKDIKKNGLYIFRKEEQKELINHILTLLNNKNNKLLLLQVKSKGYHTEHIYIDSNQKLNLFIKSLSKIYKKYSEIWVITSSVFTCWRCRIYLSNNLSNKDIIELAYSDDDHILNNIKDNNTVPYICFSNNKSNLEIIKTNLNKNQKKEATLIVEDILKKYTRNFNSIKKDLEFIGLEGISLDVRINNGYDFHDFDVDYNKVKVVIDYYLT